MCSCTGCCHVNQKELLKGWIFLCWIGASEGEGKRGRGEGAVYAYLVWVSCGILLLLQRY